MSSTRNSWVQAARWLVVTLVALVIVAQPLPGSVREPVAKPGACCNKCECCVSSNSGNAPQPTAPAPARTTVAKDFHLVPFLNAPLLSAPTVGPLISFDSRASNFSASLPLFIRHCTFLI
jgi:hypothetical protein